MKKRESSYLNEMYAHPKINQNYLAAHFVHGCDVINCVDEVTNENSTQNMCFLFLFSDDGHDHDHNDDESDDDNNNIVMMMMMIMLMKTTTHSIHTVLFFPTLNDRPSIRMYIFKLKLCVAILVTVVVCAKLYAFVSRLCPSTVHNPV